MSPDVIQSAFQIGDVALWSILLGSAFVLALAGEQIWVSWRLVDGARRLGAEVGMVLLRGDLQGARTIAERSDSPVSEVFVAALGKVNHRGESFQRTAERERQRLGLWMRRRLWAIGTVGAIAPFVGLFGTVVGIIRAFRDIAQAGSGGFSVVAQGVSEALVATAGGIFVAVLAVVLYNYLNTRVGRATVEIRLVVDEFVEQLGLAVEREPSPPPREAAPAEG